MQKLFQSYLVIGDKISTREQSREIAKNAGISFSPASPDLQIIKTEKEHITIDQVRNLKRNIFEKPLKEKCKLIILAEAHKLTIEAQSALLKILEEPPLSALVILEAKSKDFFLKTILSRVKIEKAESKINQIESLLLKKEPLALKLQVISEVEDVDKLLEEELISLHSSLVQAANQMGKAQLTKVVFAIEKCKDARQMIGANVNPKFTLFNLIVSTNLASMQLAARR